MNVGEYIRSGGKYPVQAIGKHTGKVVCFTASSTGTVVVIGTKRRDTYKVGAHSSGWNDEQFEVIE